jgi:hypothetical protein
MAYHETIVLSFSRESVCLKDLPTEKCPLLTSISYQESGGENKCYYDSKLHNVCWLSSIRVRDAHSKLTR